MKRWVYILRLVRPEAGPNPTDAEAAIVSRHFAHLKTAHDAGRVILAGPCEDYAFGVVVFEAPDEAAARAFMDADPAVAEGLMTARLHPFRVSLMRSFEV